jgi:hypothetical protein
LTGTESEEMDKDEADINLMVSTSGGRRNEHRTPFLDSQSIQPSPRLRETVNLLEVNVGLEYEIHKAVFLSPLMAGC